MPSLKHRHEVFHAITVLFHPSLVRPLTLVCLIVLFGAILPMWAGSTPNALAWFANDLFQNADFETGSMTPWTQSAGPAGDVTVTTGNNRTPGGSWNAILKGDNNNTVELKQRVNGLTAGPIYYLGAFVRQTNSTGDPLGFGATSYGYTNCGGFAYVNPPNWELLSCQGVIPSGYDYLAPKMSYKSTSPYYAATDDWYLARTPLTTTTIYVGSVDYNTLYNYGRTAGTKLPQGNVVVLDYGYPSSQSSIQGARVFNGTNDFHSTSDIQAAVQGYMDGFWAGTGSSGALLTVAVGVNNAAYQGTNGVVSGHATAWAGMVNNLQSYINSHGYGTKLSVAGAMDIEQDPTQGFQSYTVTKAWVDAWGNATTRPYYDFGSCTSCPSTNYPTSQMPGGWTPDNVFYVAYGASRALPLPEIYAQSGINGDQWYRVALNHSPVMFFPGTLTQWMACQQEEAHQRYCYGINPPVDGTKNYPGMGWGQLSQFLNLNSVTSQSPIWSTDIMWQYP